MRFATAKDLADEFPQLSMGFQSTIDATDPLTYVDRLVANGKLADAISFLAHFLPRREVVWWAAQAVRSEPTSFNATEVALLDVAERWARDPSESLRKDALALANDVDMARAAGWVARAAGWSGGTLVDLEAYRAPVQPGMCPAAARAAVLAASSVAQDPTAYLRRCVDHALTLAKRG